MKTHHFDFLIIGTGIAGLSAAKVLKEKGKVAILTKGGIKSGSTTYAQGGIAAAMTPDDTPKHHLEDTLQAGDGLCDEAMVKILVEEGPARVEELINLGAQFHKSGEGYDLTQEGAHSQRRILHAKDATGREIEKALGTHLLSHPNIEFFTQCSLSELIIQEGQCVGIKAFTTDGIDHFYAKAVILATGGVGQVYHYNTNPPVATGDGIALAYEAGASLKHMEFMQFHPTTLYLGDKKPISLFLISEALRGEGGILRNIKGEAFMSKYHPQAELASRDIVSRAIFEEMKQGSCPHVYLDLTGLEIDVESRFPNIYKRCLEANIDLKKDFVPVSPAAHYFMGGIQTDEWGQTTIPRLYAVGETACLGLHGANRLASNSLLDGLVFGHRAGVKAAKSTTLETLSVESDSTQLTSDIEPSVYLAIRQQCRQVMWECVGIIRDGKGLEKAIKNLKNLRDRVTLTHQHPLVLETRCMLTVSLLMAQAALDREESRGAHYRADFSE